jgi:hypothetical protein
MRDRGPRRKGIGTLPVIRKNIDLYLYRVVAINYFAGSLHRGRDAVTRL